MSIDEGFGDTLPTHEQWSEIVTQVMLHYRPARVPLYISFGAAKELAQYKRAKLKAVDQKNNSQDGSTAGDLTEEEIKLFKRAFNSEF